MHEVERIYIHVRNYFSSVVVRQKETHAVLVFDCIDQNNKFIEFEIPYVVVIAGKGKEYLNEHYDFFRKLKLKEKLKL